MGREPAAKGVLTATAWGAPATGAHGALHKFTAGLAAPRHTHSAGTKIVVTCGTKALAGGDGKETKFPPVAGDTQPKAYPH